MPALCSGLSLRSSPEHSASPSLYPAQQAAKDGPELTATSGPRLLAKPSIILDWVQGQIPLAEHITWARRLEVIRPFAKYRARFDPRTEIPDAHLFGKGHRRLTPHIYSDQEIVDLLRAAREMTPQGTLRPATYEALFGLIAAAGLRISEALHLRCKDIDLVQGMLTIRQTKFSKSRLVPLHATAVKALQKYTAFRQLYVPVRLEALLFVSASGAGLVNRTVHGVFERLRAELGWTARGAHAAPRIHDLSSPWCKQLNSRRSGIWV